MAYSHAELEATEGGDMIAKFWKFYNAFGSDAQQRERNFSSAVMAVLIVIFGIAHHVFT